MGNEGNIDQEEGDLAIKGEHKQYRHHSKSRKHRKNNAHHASGGISEKDGLKKQQNKEKLADFSDTRQLKPQISGSDNEYREFPIARGKRSTPDISQWQEILDTLEHGETGATTQTNTDTESNTEKQLEILEAIEHQLEEEIAKSEGARHGHHSQHPSIDIKAKKEEIQVLKEIEDSLLDQQTPPTEDNHAITTGDHTHHGSSHHHKHGQLQEAAESKPLHDAGNQAHHSHSHSKSSTHADADSTANLDELEKQVFTDILKAESDGLTRKEGIQLEREIESLEEIEKQTTEDLIKNSGPQTK